MKIDYKFGRKTWPPRNIINENKCFFIFLKNFFTPTFTNMRISVYGNFLSLFDYLMITQSKSRIRSVVNVQYNIFHGARS